MRKQKVDDAFQKFIDIMNLESTKTKSNLKTAVHLKLILNLSYFESHGCLLKLIQNIEPKFVCYMKNDDRKILTLHVILFSILKSSYKNELMFTSCCNTMKLFDCDIESNLKKHINDQKIIEIILAKIKKLGVDC